MQIRYYEWFQLLSLLTAIYCHKELKSYSLLLFIPFLFIITGVEFIATNIIYLGGKSNYSLYNFNLLISVPFYLYIFGQILSLKKKEKTLFSIISILCIVLLLLNFFFLQGSNTFNSYGFLFFEIINIVFSCITLLQLAIDEKTKTALLKKPYFWIAAPTLLFSLGTIVVLGLQQYILSNHIQMDGKSIYRIIVPPLNVLLYTGYTYAFVLCRIHRYPLL